MIVIIQHLLNCNNIKHYSTTSNQSPLQQATESSSTNNSDHTKSNGQENNNSDNENEKKSNFALMKNVALICSIIGVGYYAKTNDSLINSLVLFEDNMWDVQDYYAKLKSDQQQQQQQQQQPGNVVKEQFTYQKNSLNKFTDICNEKEWDVVTQALKSPEFINLFNEIMGNYLLRCELLDQFQLYKLVVAIKRLDSALNNIEDLDQVDEKTGVVFNDVRIARNTLMVVLDKITWYDIPIKIRYQSDYLSEIERGKQDPDTSNECNKFLRRLEVKIYQREYDDMLNGRKVKTLFKNRKVY
ncbi:hypothetical protein PPL_02264 [Heterostelium album PN500]|uniref:Uncharacterized protein n=1 Tax=Heterostelium pallidum (strain ATCC 26659 / Pp 5 / PN500) TaxID=670386 RepID=D3B1U0_HETP5|nr:hypothetical protein PPL_02264 [Heterostelium album PN500]EFA85264.1 hypothetical protein PPL_02264 [Heterostelium album PN500]|eukprot:XP_020437373.1 hypothetical protein PPL_02264 [Heterostelium album PN500]